jgi:ADP-ribose pyrophosphatase
MPTSGPSKIVVHGKQRIFDGFFKIDEAELSYERFDGAMTPVVKRLCFERGDSVAAIIKHRDSGAFLFLKQFRYPTVEKGPGWILEVVAGMQEHGEEPEVSLRRELIEEIGYDADLIEPIATFYVSPGGTSERIHLFYAEVSEGSRKGTGGGLLEENEDIATVRYSEAEIDQALARGDIQDAKTLVGIFWLRARTRK